MVYSINIKKQRVFRQIFLLVFVSSFLTTSCKVSWVATYDYMVAQQIEVVAKKVDKFYLTMLETTSEENERQYSKFVKEYIDIEVELNALLNKNQIRPLNKESTRNCVIALQYWIKYKVKHKKDNVISDVDIELNRDYLHDLFIVIQIGEEAKNKLNK